MLLRFRLMRVAARSVTFLAGGAVALTAWIVFAANSETRDGRDLSVSQDRLWSASVSGANNAPSVILTQGAWFCTNPECRYRSLSGGAPFRSSSAQACSLCRCALEHEKDAQPFSD